MNRRMSALLLSSAMSFSCGEDDSSAEHVHEHGDAAVYQGCPDSTPEFTLGMRAQGESGLVWATLVAADPAPPMRYRNDWILTFEDAAGAPLSDLSITEARPFMPVHGHDGNVQPIVRRAEDGSFHLDYLNLNMRGPWEIQLHVSSESRGTDYIVFHVCVLE